MRYIFYVNGEKVTTNDWDEIPRRKVSSPNENTPALESYSGYKIWCLEGLIIHRLTGPAKFYYSGKYDFFLIG
jgi:hypothetical protein